MKHLANIILFVAIGLSVAALFLPTWNVTDNYSQGLWCTKATIGGVSETTCDGVFDTSEAHHVILRSMYVASVLLLIIGFITRLTSKNHKTSNVLVIAGSVLMAASCVMYAVDHKMRLEGNLGYAWYFAASSAIMAAVSPALLK